MGRVVLLVLKVTLVGTGLLGLALGVVVVLTDPKPKTLAERAWRSITAMSERRASPPSDGGGAVVSEEKLPPFSDVIFDDSGYGQAVTLSAPIANPTSLTNPASLSEIRDSVRGRGRRGIAYFEGKLAALPPDDPASSYHARQLQTLIGTFLMYEGRWDEASARFAKAQAVDPVRSGSFGTNLEALRGVAAAKTWRDRELRGLLQRIELHLPPGPRRRPPAALRLSGGDRALHPLPPAEAGGPGGPVAAQCRLHDPGGVSGGGPLRVPPAAGPARRAEGRHAGADDQRGVPRRAQHAGRVHVRRLPGRRLRWRRPPGPLHAHDRPGTRGIAAAQPRQRHFRGPLRAGRPGRSGPVPERLPRRLRQRRRPRHPDAPGRLGIPDADVATAQPRRWHLRRRHPGCRPRRPDRFAGGRLGRLRQRWACRPLRRRRVPRRAPRPAQPRAALPQPRGRGLRRRFRSGRRDQRTVR